MINGLVTQGRSGYGLRRQPGHLCLYACAFGAFVGPHGWVNGFEPRPLRSRRIAAKQQTQRLRTCICGTNSYFSVDDNAVGQQRAGVCEHIRDHGGKENDLSANDFLDKV
jgi:hypothetical protein